MKKTNLLMVLALAMPACVVSGRGTMSVDTTPVAVYQAPPPPQQESVTMRPGFLWIKGRWNWQGGQWVWAGGHYERERNGYYWADGSWRQQGNQWVWVEGTWQTGGAPMNGGGSVIVTTGGNSQPSGNWGNSQPSGNWGNSTPPPTATSGQGGVASTSNVVVTASAYPNAAPPPLRVESYGAARPGFIWISGRWDWRGGQWAWVDGHWERDQPNMMWVSGSWQNNGGRWVWVEGTWQARAQAAPSGQGPVVRDHRTH